MEQSTSTRVPAAVSLLGSALLLVSTSANSQAHGPSSSSSSPPGEMGNSDETAALRAVKRAELTDWLTRLVGKFRFEGDVAEIIGVKGGPNRQVEVIYSRSGVHGVGDCAHVGEGPGVQCMINVTWIPTMRWHRSQMTPLGPAGAPATPGRAQFMTLDPAAILCGIDPDKLEIRYMQVNSRSIATGGNGSLEGDMVTFTVPCKIPDQELPGTCEQSIQITAKPDLRRIYIRIDVTDSVNKGPPFISYGFVMQRLTENGTQE